MNILLDMVEDEMRSMVWTERREESQKAYKWKSAMRQSYRHAQGEVWSIRNPHTSLRCDICRKGKKQIATYASYNALHVYCDVHSPL